MSVITRDVDDFKQTANFDTSTINDIEEKVKKIEEKMKSRPEIS